MSLLNYAVLLGAAASTAYGHGIVRYLQAGDGPLKESFNLDWTYNQGAHTATRAAAPGWFMMNQDNGFVQPDGKASGGPNAGVANLQNLICGPDATAGGADFPVAAGSDLKWIWGTWPESHKGPVITYLAKCPGDTCAGVEKSSLKFFKIEEAGYDAAAKTWAADSVNQASNFTWSTSIPASLPDGAYVARHEIIALHSAGSENGAQIYPNCANIKVSGGSGSMSTDGVDASTMYTPSSPGLVVNIYGNLADYTIPGPPLRTGSGGGSGGSPPQQPAPPSPPTPQPTSTAPSTPPPSPTGGSGSAKPMPEGTTLEDLLAWLKIILNRTSPTKRSEFFSRMLM